MLFFVLFTSLLLFLYSNVLFYCFTLIVFSVVLIVSLVSHGLLPSLLGYIVITIYLGAMMILIGYMCAVCPNPLISSSFNFVWFSLLSALVLGTLFSSDILNFGFQSSFSSVGGVLFGGVGVVFLGFIFISLFVILLMVTTQLVVKGGPFRSI